MRIRTVAEAEAGTVAGFLVDEPVSWITGERFRQEYSERHFRPEWTWIAENDEGRIVARALWWGKSDSEHPVALDCLHVLGSVEDRAGLAAELLAAGHTAFERAGAKGRPQYNISLENGWRERPEVAAAVAWRSEAARRAGLTEEVERLRYEWTPGAGLPAPATRLEFRPDSDDEAFLEAFKQIAVGSLDIATLRELPVLGADRQAREDLEFYLSCPGKREWWRLAYTPEGELAGMAIPSATPYNRNVGYLGVVPAMRGRGYIDEVLGEITRLHAADGAELITATTDTTNTPMAAAFERAGYANTEIRLVFEAPAS
ncbi:GNAT family N-acetyltransferase [Streptomyces dangxiongensis]|uniref:GNAT family N-acetyltransferase n=1 Tax=Streptomyces dangxiongensis TaxID=1442032 RepID=A0A3G2J697_9ACTN|nr:GNAT family N-acetyltransferase [Streptomyces dangxiongensis]AYN37718.1 GNAT family N-acetyltransferase [Streptomyces dangxiongensis]